MLIYRVIQESEICNEKNTFSTTNNSEIIDLSKNVQMELFAFNLCFTFHRREGVRFKDRHFSV